LLQRNGSVGRTADKSPAAQPALARAPVCAKAMPRGLVGRGCGEMKWPIE